ncbi:MAG: conjugal transfer protein TraF [bacterium]
MKYKISKLKIVFLIFLIAMLVSRGSFASILNIEQRNQKIGTRSFANISHRAISSMFNSYNRSGSQFIRDYEFVFFYSLGCAYCRNFTPVLKQYSDNTGINVRGFILGGNSSNTDSYFPDFFDSTVIKQEVSERFFGKESNIAVPALFILNNKSLHVYPVSRGSLTYSELARIMDELMPKILNSEAKMMGKNHA